MMIFYSVSESFAVNENYWAFYFRVAKNMQLLLGIYRAVLATWLVCHLTSIAPGERHAGLHLP